MAAPISDLRGRELLSASLRQRRAREEDDDDLVVAARAPGKRKAAGDDEPLTAPTAPAESPRGSGPIRLDRYADGDDGDDAGLGAALGLIADARGGVSLPAELARRLEAELGIALDGVRLHDDARSHQACAEVRARAFTIGTDIYFAKGALDLASESGVELIAHEVAHVAQQARGTAPTGRGVSRPTDGHEREADRFARRFQSRQTVEYKPKAGDDPARVVDYARSEGRRIGLPFQAELEEHLGTSFDFVEAYTGPAAQIACQALAASAMVVRNIVMFADDSPNKAQLLHELSHVEQMGRRQAPARFALGTLKVSGVDDAAEVEARTGVQAPTVRADPDTIHRDPQTPATTAAPAADPATTKAARIAYFIANKKLETFPQDGPGGEKKYAFKNAAGHRYTRSSPEPWKREEYFRVITSPGVGTRPPPVQIESTTADIAELIANKAQYRIANVTSNTYAFVMDGDYAESVEDIRPEVRPRANPVEQFACYLDVTKKLAHRLQTFTWPTTAEQYQQNVATMTESEATGYRRALRAALVDGYKVLPGGGWEQFYSEVMQGTGTGGGRLIPPQYNGMTGAIFEELVRQSGLELTNTKPFFKHAALSQMRIGDNTRGAVLIDDKAATSGAIREQALDYATIVRQQIPGWIKGEDENNPQRKFSAVLYIAAGQVNADTITRQLDTWITDPATRSKMGTSPDPEGVKRFCATFNPTLEFTTRETGRGTYNFTNPTNPIAGVTVRRATFRTTPDDKQVTGGQIQLGVDMAGAVTNPNVTKDIQPAPTPGTINGTVENKLTGFRSTIDRFLGAADVDAKLIDGGVEASIKLRAGSSPKLPGFDLEAATVTARYVNGALQVDGAVAIRHRSGKLSGRINLSWDGAQWSFTGEGTLAAGLVPGLSAVTVGVKYEGGKTKIYAQQAQYERQVGAIKLKGTVTNLEYDVDKAGFSGAAQLEADLGMFGKASASATLENNDLKTASLSYDSPQFKYPAQSGTPAFTGTVGGTVTYNAGKWSGAIRGSANVNLPGLRAVAGEQGLGLAVDAHIGDDGSYTGTVRTTAPLNFGRHVQVPSIACTIKPDGSLEGSFEVKIVNIKFLTAASIRCTVTADGIQVEDANLTVPFGNENGGSFWGSLTVGYSRATGLAIGGTVNYKIKEGMIATGTLRYATETHEVSLEMTVSEIKLLDKTVSKQLFKAAKQIPIINVWGLGVYIDIGFELGFNFGFQLGLRPTVTFEGLSLETFEFRRIAARLELLGKIYAELTGTPKLGLGVFALDPRILRGGGGLKVPIVGRAEINPTGSLDVGYTPGGGVEGDAKVGMNMTFGITGSVKPYAELSVLDGLWNPSWEGDALASFEILKPKELFNFVVDVGGDMRPKDAPELPAENAARDPSPPQADRVLPETKSAPTERAGGGASREAQGPTTPPAESGNEGPFSLSALRPMLEQLPGAASVKRILQKAGEVWDRIKNFFGRIVAAFKNVFSSLVSRLEEILDGFAREGLGYLPKLVKMLVGDTVYEIIEPLILQMGDTAEAILDLFATSPPTNLADAMPWVWTVAKKALSIAFDSLSGFISAIGTMISRAAAVAQRLVSRAVTDGWVGVKRHEYYIWRPWPWDNYEFMAAAEYKLNIPGIANLGQHGPDGILLTPSSAVAIGLYELLGSLGVPITYGGRSSFGEPFNDRWTGGGARG